VEIQGVEPSPEGPPHNVDYIQTVQGPYLETMGIEVRRGRRFEPRDRAGSVPVALVNERLARTFFPDADALGQRMRLCCGGDIWFQVVGVVEDVRQGGLDRPAGTEIYFLQEQLTEAYGWAIRSMHLVVETPGDPGSLGPEVRRAVASLDPSLPVAAMRPMREVLERARARPRFLTTLLAAFSGVALLLAAVGTYGVMSFAVAQRAREMGIRMALGAEAGAVRRLVLRRGLVLAGVGLGLGVAGAWWLTGLLESLLFGIAARDPLTFSLVPLLLVAVAAAASWIPAHRATRVDPVEVLRQE
jgi:predicted permease